MELQFSGGGAAPQRNLWGGARKRKADEPDGRRGESGGGRSVRPAPPPSTSASFVCWVVAQWTGNIVVFGAAQVQWEFVIANDDPSVRRRRSQSRAGDVRYSLEKVVPFLRPLALGETIGPRLPVTGCTQIMRELVHRQDLHDALDAHAFPRAADIRAWMAGSREWCVDVLQQAAGFVMRTVPISWGQPKYKSLCQATHPDSRCGHGGSSDETWTGRGGTPAKQQIQ